MVEQTKLVIVTNPYRPRWKIGVFSSQEEIDKLELDRNDFLQIVELNKLTTIEPYTSVPNFEGTGRG